MQKVFHVQGSPDGGLKFKSDYHRALFKDFLKANPNIYLKITPNEEIPSHFRRFFEGGIVPFFALQHFVIDPDNGKWGMMSNEEARECLKREFNPMFFRDLAGKVVQQGGATATMTKKEFQAFIERCIDYMLSNGYTVPDNEEFKRWRDSCPEIDEEYPPVQRLKDLANKKLVELNGYVARAKKIQDETS